MQSLQNSQQSTHLAIRLMKKDLADTKLQLSVQKRKTLDYEKKLLEQTRMMNEQGRKISNQDRIISDLNKKILGYDQKFEDIITEITRLRSGASSELLPTENIPTAVVVTSGHSSSDKVIVAVSDAGNKPKSSCGRVSKRKVAIADVDAEPQNKRLLRSTRTSCRKRKVSGLPQ